MKFATTYAFHSTEKEPQKGRESIERIRQIKKKTDWTKRKKGDRGDPRQSKEIFLQNASNGDVPTCVFKNTISRSIIASARIMWQILLEQIGKCCYAWLVNVIIEATRKDRGAQKKCKYSGWGCYTKHVTTSASNGFKTTSKKGGKWNLDEARE